MSYQVGRKTVALGVLLVLVIGASGYLFEREKIKRITKEALQFRVDSFGQYLHLMTTNNVAMHNSMRSHYALARQGDLNNHILDEVTYFAEHQVYSVPVLNDSDHTHVLHGTLTIDGSVDITDPDLRHELTAVLSLDEQLAVYVGEANLALMTYYISAKKFIYLLPVLPVESFKFSSELYSKPFWSQVEPRTNPFGKQIITALYEDTTGQGLMITIASPVTIGDQFLGVICIDVGITYMQSVLSIGNAVGQSMLVDEEGLLVARPGDLAPGERVNVAALNTQQGWVELDDVWLYSEPIHAGELYFVHRLPKYQLMISAVQASLTIWLLLCLGGVLSYLAYSQRNASLKHKALTLLDPLTQLYNRRGLEALVAPIYAHLERSQQNAAILLIDIDKFKKINDTYGHGVGDEVLKSTAQILSKFNRKGAICARWGGEEFVIFLQAGTANGAQLVAERIRQQVESRRHSQLQLQVTISVGVAVADGSISFETAIERADQALYQAKQDGRNRVVLYS